MAMSARWLAASVLAYAGTILTLLGLAFSSGLAMQRINGHDQQLALLQPTSERLARIETELIHLRTAVDGLTAALLASQHK